MDRIVREKKSFYSMNSVETESGYCLQYGNQLYDSWNDINTLSTERSMNLFLDFNHLKIFMNAYIKSSILSLKWKMNYVLSVLLVHNKICLSTKLSLHNILDYQNHGIASSLTISSFVQINFQCKFIPCAQINFFSFPVEQRWSVIYIHILLSCIQLEKIENGNRSIV